MYTWRGHRPITSSREKPEVSVAMLFHWSMQKLASTPKTGAFAVSIILCNSLDIHFLSSSPFLQEEPFASIPKTHEFCGLSLWREKKLTCAISIFPFFRPNGNSTELCSWPWRTACNSDITISWNSADTNSYKMHNHYDNEKIKKQLNLSERIFFKFMMQIE